jgi:hypothetical protein
MVKPTAAAIIERSTNRGAAGHSIILENSFEIGPAAGWEKLRIP